jgi:hypothetical protein
VAGLINGAGIVSGRLILSLDNGEIIDAGFVQGPQGLKGDRGALGSVGPKGQDGRTIHHGVGFPTPTDPPTAVDGDFYYSTDKVAFFGPRVNGNWGKPVYLRPQDNKSFTLPTGMKAQGGAAGARAFAAGISGPSSGGVPSAGPATGSLELIIGHNQPLLANTPSPVAIDTTGDAMIVDLWAQGPQGTLFVEVAVSKGAGTDTGYSVVYEVRMGAVPPVLTFTPGTNAAGTDLQLQVSSDVNLVTLRGRIMKI